MDSITIGILFFLCGTVYIVYTLKDLVKAILDKSDDKHHVA
jgi:hypothetical protein